MPVNCYYAKLFQVSGIVAFHDIKDATGKSTQPISIYFLLVEKTP